MRGLDGGVDRQQEGLLRDLVDAGHQLEHLVQLFGHVVDAVDGLDALPADRGEQVGELPQDRGGLLRELADADLLVGVRAREAGLASGEIGQQRVHQRPLLRRLCLQLDEAVAQLGDRVSQNQLRLIGLGLDDLNLGADQRGGPIPRLRVVPAHTVDGELSNVLMVTRHVSFFPDVRAIVATFANLRKVPKGPNWRGAATNARAHCALAPSPDPAGGRAMVAAP